MIDRSELIDTFLEVARLSEANLSRSDLQVEFGAPPHSRPTELPADKQAVYAFFLGEHCLKVGKAGPKTKARFCSQHYGLNAPSTLAKSILANLGRVQGCLPIPPSTPLALTQETIGDWIEANTARMNVLIPSSSGPFVLSLLEAYLHCRLQPMFEGADRPRSWSWSVLPVDEGQDHIDLHYAPASAAPGAEPVLLARVGQPVRKVFPVQWLVDPARHPDAVEAVKRELDFYLVNKGEPDPWRYAQHHCGTAANVYSAVHWSFHPGADNGAA